MTPVTHVLELARREHDLVVRWIRSTLRIKAQLEGLKFENEEGLTQHVEKLFAALMQDKVKLRQLIEQHVQAFYKRRGPA